MGTAAVIARVRLNPWGAGHPGSPSRSSAVREKAFRPPPS